MARTSSTGRLAGLLLLGSALATMMGSVDAMTHVVGGSYGWQVPVESYFFEEWAKPRTFGVGDKLIFPYSPGSNNVLVVKKEEFDHCTQNSPVEIHYMGPTTFSLTTAGDYYFITSFGKHCEYGQKLHVTVDNAQGSSGQKPTRRLLAALSPADAPAPGPASSAAAPATVGAAAAVVSGILASLVSLWM